MKRPLPDGTTHLFFTGLELLRRVASLTPKVTCLDTVDIDELVRAPIIYVDGRHDDFKSPPAESRHL